MGSGIDGIKHEIYAVNANRNSDGWNVNVNEFSNSNRWNVENHVSFRNYLFSPAALLWEFLFQP